MPNFVEGKFTKIMRSKTIILKVFHLKSVKCSNIKKKIYDIYKLQKSNNLHNFYKLQKYNNFTGTWFLQIVLSWYRALCDEDDQTYTIKYKWSTVKYTSIQQYFTGGM